MRISPTSIWTPVLTRQKPDGLSTMCRMIRQHPERNHQATANSHTVHGVLGYLMSLTGTRQKVMWAGTLRWMGELASHFQSLQRRVSSQFMIGVCRRCGCFQVCLNIQRVILWWKSTVPRHCIPQWTVWRMLSGLKTKTLNGMRHTGWCKLESTGLSGGGQNRKLQMRYYLFGHRRRIHTLLIPNGQNNGKQKCRPSWRDSLHREVQERGGFLDGG